MLAVDIGNTFTRVVAFDGDVIKGRHSFHSRDLKAGDLAPAFAEFAGFAASGGVWTASVVPAAEDALARAADDAGLRHRFIRSARDTIIRHALKTPETTGVDRLLSAMAAGIRHFPGAQASRGYVVVQCGSAATVDLVDGAGVYRGGYIIPGPGLWLSGLAGAAQLPDLSTEPPDWGAVSVGDNTRDAILHGMTVGLPIAVASAAMIIHVNLPTTMGKGRGGLPVAVTGGWGEVAAKAMDVKHVYDRDLLLHGIRLFAEREGGL